MKSLTLRLPSMRSPRQSNWPVAANEREIDGQASDEVDVAETLGVVRVLIVQHAVLDADLGEG